MNNESSTQSSDQDVLSALAGESVLLIDDEEVVRDIGLEMLDSLGMQCITACNGEEGIRVFRDSGRDFKCVILDVEMPGVSGDKVFHELKRINPHVKILVISGYAKNYLETKYFKKPLEHFMPKPFQLNQLTHKLSALMRVS